MPEINNHDRPPEDPGAQPIPARISRRSLVKAAGLFAVGGIAGGFLTHQLFPADKDHHLPSELSEADYKRLEETGNAAKQRAKELQARINETMHNNKLVDVSVLDEMFLQDRVGAPAWRVDSPILLGDPPKISDVDKGFWFGMQYPNVGTDGSSSVGIRAVLFDPTRMILNYFVPEGQDTLAAQQMQLFVMPPDAHTPHNNLIAYGYNEVEPDHRQRRNGDPSQVIVPGLQVPVA